MGLINDARFYLMIALAALFLIVVAMCSSTQHGGTDAHMTSGVTNSSTASADAASDDGETVMEENADQDANAEADDAENKMEETVEAETATDTQALVATDTATSTEDMQAANTTEEAATEEATEDAATAEEGTEETAAEEAAEATEDAATTEEASEEAATEDAAAADSTENADTDAASSESTTESVAMSAEVEAFELSELASTGEMLPDFGTDLGNLKSDMGRFSGRVDEATGLFEQVKEMISK